MRILAIALSFGLAAATCCGQDAQDELTGFDWLKQFEGDWSTQFDGTMNSRVVGKKWVVNEYTFPSGLFAIQALGYDEEKKQFVGTWVDASSSFIWRYSGKLDPTGKILVLDAEGPDLKDPSKMRAYRDSYEFTSRDEIAAVSRMLDDKKEWKTFSDSKMKRKVAGNAAARPKNKPPKKD